VLVVAAIRKASREGLRERAGLGGSREGQGFSGGVRALQETGQTGL